jgi:hypothetical protein
MTETVGGTQLQLKLPPSWLQSDPLMLSESDLPAPVRAALLTSDGSHHFPAPDLMASVITPVVDANGRLEEVVIASLVAVTVPTAQLGELAPSLNAVEIVEGVPVVEGISADFLTLILPVQSEDSEQTTLLCFSSPNLTLAADMEAGFRAIARTARLRPVVEDA